MTVWYKDRQITSTFESGMDSNTLLLIRGHSSPHVQGCLVWNSLHEFPSFRELPKFPQSLVFPFFLRKALLLFILGDYRAILHWI